MIVQAVSLLGAGLILAAFAMQLQGRWSAQGNAYLACNLFGSALLTAVAIIERQWGFLLLESVWCLVTAQAWWRRGRR